MAGIFQQLFSECPLVDEATEDSDATTPGFIYNDIIQLTQKSGEECAKVINHLFSRLNLRRPKIKLKALALIRQLLTRGPAQCKREILRRAELLRACLSFRGPADPLHGDAQYAAVRDAAQALINSLYDTTDASVSPVGGSMGSGGAGSAMTGFGNVAAPSTSTASHSSSLTSSGPRSMGSSSTSQGQYTYVQSSRAIGHFIPVPEEDNSTQDRVSHAAGAVIDFIRSKVTGVSDSTPPPQQQPQNFYVPSRGVGSDGSRFVNYQQHLMNPDGLKNVQPMGGWVDAAEVSGGAAPMNPIVEQLLAGTTTPSRTDIAHAIQSIQSSSVEMEDVIGQLCVAAVAAQSAVRWQQRLRALVLLDALRQYASPSSFLASQEFLGLFENAYPQFALHKSVQDKAEQLWVSLYGPNRPSPLQREITAKANAQKSTSLFDGLSAASSEEPNPTDTSSAVVDSSTASIFSSLSLSSQSPAPISPPSQASKSNNTLMADDLLLLNFGDQQQQQQQQQPQPPQQQQAQSGAQSSPLLLSPMSSSRPVVPHGGINAIQSPTMGGASNLMMTDLSGLSFPTAAPARPAQPQAPAATDSFSFVASEFKKKDSSSPGMTQAAAGTTTSNSGSSFDFL
eukprot:TRINITY_DN806_c0_g1_i1.p1 TRINITY_DN806_c0_g1~~TRINITY_DN806_c0_g1_i1.p1  ORF type:complete len:622 (-),score=117.32 TRINITY_DN806_c0_g1_i1:108-1973(-)